MHFPKLSDISPRFLKPDIILKSVHELTPSLLSERGIQCLVFDIDDTLTYHNGNEISHKTLSYLEKLRKESGVSYFVASNSQRDLSAIGAQLNATIIKSTWLRRKPRRKHYKRIVRETGFDAANIAMVGDKITTDILGANLAGMTSIWVLSRKQKFFENER